MRLALSTFVPALGCCLSAACAFQPGGVVDDSRLDAAAVTDDAPAASIDARVIDAPAVPTDAAVSEGVIRAAALTAAPLLDGVATELAASTRYAMDLATAANTEFVAGYTPSMSAGLRVGHDATHLHLLFDVIEAKPHSGDSTSTWENDAITFYIDSADDRAGAYGADDHEVIIDYRPVYGIYPATNGADPTIQSVRLPTAEGFTVEIRIAKATLGATLGARIGFAWGVIDDDGGGNADGYGLAYVRPAPRCASCCTAFSRAEAWCDTTMLGEIALGD